jgi:hypothetical protein
MRRIETRDPNQLAYRSGGGCASLFGLPFFAFGLFFALMALFGGISSKSGSAEMGGRLIGSLFGLLFAGVGSAFLFGRSGLVFDKSRRTVTRWYGLLVPMWSNVQESAAFRDVSITQETRTRRSKHGTRTYTVFPVRLTGGGKFDIAEPKDAAEARRIAEEIAKFLNLGVTDSSGGQTVRREAGTLDISLRDRLRRGGTEAKAPPRPPGARAIVRHERTGVRIEVPPPPLNLALLLPLVAGLVFAVFVGFIFLLPLLCDSQAPVGVKLFFGLFIGGIFMVLPVGTGAFQLLSQLKRSAVVEADPTLFRVTTQGLLRARTVEMRTAELEELRLDGRRGAFALAAISDRQIARFGEGLSHEEQEYLRGEIQAAITR